MGCAAVSGVTLPGWERNIPESWASQPCASWPFRGGANGATSHRSSKAVLFPRGNSSVLGLTRPSWRTLPGPTVLEGEDSDVEQPPLRVSVSIVASPDIEYIHSKSFHPITLYLSPVGVVLSLLKLLTWRFFFSLNIVRFTNLHVVLAQGPC